MMLRIIGRPLRPRVSLCDSLVTVKSQLELISSADVRPKKFRK
jgi:hypothetical protein